MRVPVKQNRKIGGYPPNLGVAEGQIFRQAPARRRLCRPAQFSSSTRQNVPALGESP